MNNDTSITNPEPGRRPTIDDYRGHLALAGLAGETIRAYALWLLRWIDWCADQPHDPTDLDPWAVRQWSTTLPDGTSTRQQAQAAMKRWADLVDANRGHCDAIERASSRGRPKSWKPLTGVEARRLLAAADDAGMPGTLVYIGLYAALRRGELAPLRWEYVDLGNDQLMAYREKIDDWHQVPLHPRLRERLEPRHEGEGWVFPGINGGHIAHGTVNKWVNDVADLAGLTGVHPHRLRHTAATRIYTATRDVFACKALLGHAKLTTTQKYVQVARHVVSDALDRLDYGDDS